MLLFINRLLLARRIRRLGDVDGDFRDRMANCLLSAGYPEHALALARIEAERLVKRVLEDITISPPALFDACLRELEKAEVMSRGLVPAEIISLLHMVRVLGNKAAHDGLRIVATVNDVHLVLHALLRVAEWYFREFKRRPCPARASSRVFHPS